MSSRTTSRAALIAAAIGKSAASVEQRGAATWSATFHNGTALAVHVALENEWLRVDAPIGSPAPDPWSLLQRNATLPAGLKFAVGDAGDPPVLLRAEITLEDAVDPTGRVLDACTAIKTAAHVWDDTDNLAADDGHAIAPADIAALCTDTGWPHVERDGQSHIELDVPGAFIQARVDAAPDGGLVAVVPVGADNVAPSPNAAVALLLLRTSGAVRLVRAAADTTTRFEVAMRAPVPAAALAHAFAALSVACRMAGREAAVLSRDDAVAQAYLRHHGDRMGGR